MKKIGLLLLVVFTSFFAHAQSGERIQLVQAGSLEGIVIKGEELRKLIGNVIFKHEGALLYCDSSYQYEKKNELECFGNVRMVQGDTVTLTGKKLLYNGNTKIAVVTESVVLKDKEMTLTTDYLDYDTKSKMAKYVNGGKIIDKENVLTSTRGYYNTGSKKLWFKDNVVLVNDKEKYTLTSDTLEYNTITKIATFRGPSKVTKENDILFADHGDYDTERGQSIFTGRARVISGEVELEGDKMSYNEKGKYGVARGNVKMISKENDVIVYGDLAHYWGKDGIVKVSGKPLVKNKMDRDTLYLIADSLISVDRKNPKDTTIQEKYLKAFYNVKVYKSDLQVKCDSLVYNFVDSTIYFFNDPVMWSDGSQIEADSINIRLKNKKIHQLNTNLNSFMVSLDSIQNPNQMSGKKIIAYFKDDKINIVNVIGNGQSLYHALEEDNSKVIGLNKSECSNIVIKFQEGAISTISFIKKPDSKFIPPHEIKEADKSLAGYNWRIEEKPSEDEVVYLREKKPSFRIQIPYSYEYMEKKTKTSSQPSDNQYFLFN